MKEPIVLKRGDGCPACGGEFRAAPVPTPEEYRKAFDRENPVTLPPGSDTAPPDVRKELGELHRCASCGYQHRFELEAAAAADEGEHETAEAPRQARANKGGRK